MTKSRPAASPNSRRKPAKASKSAPTAFTYAAKANQYARDVVAGSIDACKWVRLACQRHLDDLAASKRADYAYRFDEARANRVGEFIEGLPHVKGHWAAASETISLEPWQCFILASLYGWVRQSDGLRRFRIAFILVPRKNAKSTLAAGIGLYMFAADGEFGAEVYSGATSEKQAWEVFRPARQMVERTPDLREAFGIQVGAKNLSIAANGSRFEPVIGKPGDGSSPHCAIIDEYHEHSSDTLLDTMRTGQGARKQPLLLVISTAGDNLAGPCKAMQEEVEKVLAGTVPRDELFGIVYTIDPDDDWTSEASARKANPNYGVSVFADFLSSERTAAIQDARKQGVYKTKHANVWVGANLAYFNLQKWLELADPSLRPEEFAGLPCVMGADLSSKRDITALVVVFRKTVANKDHFYVFSRFYLPDSRAMEPEAQHYHGWVRNGFLTTTPGASIDYEMILRDAIKDIVNFRASELCFDPWNAEHFAQRVAEKTPVTAVEVAQKPYMLSDAMKQVDALIMDRRIHHDGNPVMNWMIGNVVAHPDVRGAIYPRKERDESKIDGASALITAMVRALVLPPAGEYVIEVW